MTLKELEGFVCHRYHLTESDEPITMIIIDKLLKDKYFQNYQQITKEDAYSGLAAREAQGANLHGRLVQLFAWWFVEENIHK